MVHGCRWLFSPRWHSNFEQVDELGSPFWDGRAHDLSQQHPDRALDTWLGCLQLRISRLRRDRTFPLFLEPCRVSEKALAVIQEAWVSGVSV